MPSNAKTKKRSGKTKKAPNQKTETKLPKNSLDQYINKNIPSEKENLPKNATDKQSTSKIKKKQEPKTSEVKNVRKRVKPEQSNKITTWLSPNKVEDDTLDNFASCSTTGNKKQSKKSNISAPKVAEEMDEEQIPINRRKSYNFKRFGIFIPTLDEVIKDKENQDNLVQQLDDYDDSSLAEINSNYIPTPDKKTEKLDCKRLNNKQLFKYFQDNIDFLTKIQTGRIYSQRHEDYHDKNKRSNHLRCSKTNVMFSFEQMHFLANLIEEKFQDQESEYYFKVLMPELCLKIFMDVYQMSQPEAIAYIDKMRIE